MSNATKTVLWIIVLILVIWGISSAVGSAPAKVTDMTPIKIGFTGPLSGEFANIGANAKAAVEIAIDEVNAAGGINGRNLQVVFEDDQCAGAKSVSAANKLISVDKVSAILGAACSPATLAFAPVLEQAKVVGISYCSTAPKISQAGDYIFRDVPSDLFQGNYAAGYIYNTLGIKKVAIVKVNNDWGLGIGQAFSDQYTKLGGQIVLNESYDSTSKDMRAQMAKVKNSGAGLLYFAGFPDTTVVGIKQAKDLGITVPIFGADSWDDTSVWTKLGSAGNGVMYTVVGTNSSDAFKNKMSAKLGTNDIVYCSNYVYDAVKIIAQVMSKVGTDSEKIKNELYKTTYTGGVSSNKIEFDQNGDPKEANYIIKVVKDGKAEEKK